MNDEQSFVIALSRPVKAYDETVQTLTLRKPTGKDVRAIGFPYKLVGDDSVVLRADAIAAYIVALANVPMSSVDQLDPSDMNALGWAIARFFTGSAAPTKSD